MPALPEVGNKIKSVLSLWLLNFIKAYLCITGVNANFKRAGEPKCENAVLVEANCLCFTCSQCRGRARIKLVGGGVWSAKKRDSDSLILMDADRLPLNL